MSNAQFREWCLQCVERRRVLDGRFERPRRIDPAGGRGAFSLVFVARDLRSGEDVALKFLDPMCQDTYRRECFKREARVLEELVGQRDVVELKSPISSFTETVMLASGAVQVPVPIQFEYYAVELASSDVGVCVSMGSWEAEQKLVAFRTMCRAIQRLHNHGIGHRDLKPRNFLVMVDGTVKLSDFGTARHLDGRDQILASYSGPPGEVAYTAPELCALLHEGDPSIARGGDIFGLGAILFELFTGTALGNLIYDQSFIGSLIGYMYAVPRASRRAVYDGFVSSLANARPLPDLASFGPLVPGCILELLDRLYKCMASLDYKARLCNFSQIFLHIERCRLILRNERLYRRWKAEKEKRRAARVEKTRRLGERQ